MINPNPIGKPQDKPCGCSLPCRCLNPNDVASYLNDFSFKEYQSKATSTAVYPGRGSNITYPTFGLCGEAGEVAKKVKKVLRDKSGVVDDETREALVKEIGDVLWYIAALCNELQVSMENVARTNLAKLGSRKAKGTIQGSGDDR